MHLGGFKLQPNPTSSLQELVKVCESDLAG